MIRPEYDMERIGKNLKKLREAKKLSVEQVREYLCLGSVQAIYKYEKGKGYPQVDTLFAMMELYGADMKDIISGAQINMAGQKEEQCSSFVFLCRKLNFALNDRRERMKYTIEEQRKRKWLEVDNYEDDICLCK